jgi:F-type H+-transporting ATPase subunit alpha
MKGQIKKTSKKKNVTRKDRGTYVQKNKNFVGNYGFVMKVGGGIAIIKGLSKAKAGELITIKEEKAIVLSLTIDSVHAVICGADRNIKENDIAHTTGELISVNINKSILGSVINPLGVNMATLKKIEGEGVSKIPVEQRSPGIIVRQPIFEPLLTGLTIVDSLVPIGRGQRELIIGDR